MVLGSLPATGSEAFAVAWPDGTQVYVGYHGDPDDHVAIQDDSRLGGRRFSLGSIYPGKQLTYCTRRPCIEDVDLLHTIARRIVGVGDGFATREPDRRETSSGIVSVSHGLGPSPSHGNQGEEGTTRQLFGAVYIVLGKPSGTKVRACFVNRPKVISGFRAVRTAGISATAPRPTGAC